VSAEAMGEWYEQQNDWKNAFIVYKQILDESITKNGNQDDDGDDNEDDEDDNNGKECSFAKYKVAFCYLFGMNAVHIDTTKVSFYHEPHMSLFSLASPWSCLSSGICNVERSCRM
jgi:hypothetical protein